MAYSYVHASGGGGRQASSQVAAPPPPGSKDTHARKKIYSTATPSTNHRGKDVGQGRGGSGGGSSSSISPPNNNTTNATTPIVDNDQAAAWVEAEVAWLRHPGTVSGDPQLVQAARA
eukprot:CAMPEP_0177677868 /NCGR_PEP_ID=MMETSP0447-20121125/28667_1 /TAXON_ID=0 /ORGANISM="Stygamoeba regulata, Strain BSH-02190019" /LENGTH=116 /DNA_ID=CAMNT_0019186757 /DNA_START=230 /DNA_END=577 /DNA_ORIENTATION=-